ncbi:dehydrogenase E1 and transketolase domain-containing protein 1 [Gongronella butleri]|nr:dehydrogenase E1 and transketolase domain-containing protein 1 [Gongronella butleri]
MLRLHRLAQKSKPSRVAQRWYHDNHVYGYRAPKPYSMPDYTQEELANRMDNGSLLRMVQAYRTHGHRGAHLDPLGINTSEEVLALKPERYGLTDDSKVYNLSGVLHVNESKQDKIQKEEADFKTILNHLNATYCGNIAYEFMHLPSASERRWWYHAVESWNRPALSTEQKRRIHQLLSQSETFDHFLAKKFPNIKRYGLEGAESMMVALDRIFELSAKSGVSDVVIGMPHRGRLNLLCDLLEYPHAALFHKMKGNSELPADTFTSGDVLSHLASNPTLQYDGKPVHVSLLNNPSHLEAVNPVAMGKARAKQTDLLNKPATDKDCALGDRVMAIQIHGDAAFTGQGIVMESLGMSNLPHYSSGGSVHIVVNNQLGYTTPAQNSRSTAYCSDVGKMINIPIVHVNGDHPEDVLHAMDLVFEYRNKFRKDIILDLMCYRRWGHNELDEPAFTQPLMYNNIRLRKSVPEKYEAQLLAENVLSKADADAVRNDQQSVLTDQLQASASYTPDASMHLQGHWRNMKHVNVGDPAITAAIDTGIDVESLLRVGEQSVATPEGFNVHPRLKKYHIDARLKKLKQGTGLDWATGEALAFGTLLKEGYGIRISGQDVGRGTFSQRHAMLVSQDTEDTIIPLNEINKNDPTSNGFLEVANSPLNEFAVLGFEYGMSIETPERLVLWEAQFGDFFNGAQIAIDTFLTSSEEKWLRQTGLVMLLPHGQDGAGPEHSSARVERFLQMSNDPYDVWQANTVVPNWHVVNCTTPAQYFHVLRRQMLRPFRKPLVVISPKALLKSPMAVSDLQDMAPGTHFRPVLGDPTVTSPDDVDKVVFVSGKLYYDLQKEKEARGFDNRIAFVRVEELCPFPRDHLQEEISKYRYASQFVWCQDEPENAGAYAFMAPRLAQLVPQNKIDYVGRGPLSAPAVSFATRFKAEQAKLIKDAVALDE